MSSTTHGEICLPPPRLSPAAQVIGWVGSCEHQQSRHPLPYLWSCPCSLKHTAVLLWVRRLAKGDLAHMLLSALTSTSHRALELVAEVADCRRVVRRKTCSLLLYSSQVRNFSCSA